MQLDPNLRWLQDDIVGDLDDVLWVLMGTIGMLLLVACANVANLQLARTEARGRARARIALGAGWRKSRRVCSSRHPARTHGRRYGIGAGGDDVAGAAADRGTGATEHARNRRSRGARPSRSRSRSARAAVRIDSCREMRDAESRGDAERNRDGRTA